MTEPAVAGSTTEPAAAEASAQAGESERRSLLGRALVVGGGTFVSRFLGLFRDMALAAVFPRAITDAFFVAFTIPNALRQLLGEGAVSSAVVPVLTERLTRDGQEGAKAFFAKVRGVSLAALLVVTALGMLCARPLTELFASGYHDVPGQFERTVQLTRYLFPYLLFMGTAALGMAALHANKQFFVASFAPALLNIAFLLAAFVFEPMARRAGYDVSYALVVGALLGGLLQMLAQLPALRRLGYLQRPVWNLKDPHVRTMLLRILPVTFGIGVYYIDLVLSRRFLSEFGEGAQSYFSWAMRLCDFPQGIFVMALSTASLPSLAGLAARGEHEELGKTYVYGLRLALFVALPVSLLFVVLAEPLTVTLFQRGAFTPEDARETARALAVQGLGMFTVAVVRQSVPLYHALGDTKTPVIVSALDLVAFVALALGLRHGFGHVAISIAVTGSSAVQMVLLLVGLVRRARQHLSASARARLGREILGSTSRTLAASLVASAGAYGVVTLIEHAGGSLPLAFLVAAAVFGGLFLVFAWGVRSSELEVLLRGAMRRFARNKSPRA